MHLVLFECCKIDDEVGIEKLACCRSKSATAVTCFTSGELANSSHGSSYAFIHSNIFEVPGHLRDASALQSSICVNALKST